MGAGPQGDRTGTRLHIGSHLLLLTLLSAAVGVGVLVHGVVSSLPLPPILSVAGYVFSALIPPGLLGVYLLTCREPEFSEDLPARLVRLGARGAALALAVAMFAFFLYLHLTVPQRPALPMGGVGVVLGLFLLTALLMSVHMGRIASQISRESMRHYGVLAVILLCAIVPAFCVLWLLLAFWMSVLIVVLAQCVALHGLFMWQLRRWRHGAASGPFDATSTPGSAPRDAGPLHGRAGA